MIARAFVEFLIQERVIPSGATNEILETASVSGDRVDTVILDLGLASENVVLAKLGQFTKSRTVSASQLMVAPQELTALIPRRLAQRFGLIPFGREGKTLWVGAVDPGDLLVEDELSLLSGSMIRTFAALEIRIRQALARHYQVALPPRIELLGRRLETQESAPRTPVPTPKTQETSQKHTTTKARVRENQLEQTTKTRPPVPTELEISPEELALFPSFAFGNTQPPPAPEPPRVTPAAQNQRPQPPVPEETATHEDHIPDPEVRLAGASQALQNVEIRDDIADALLKFCRPLFERRMLLAVRGGTLIGWRGEGTAVEPAAVRAVAIPKDQPSVFSGLLQGNSFWLGPLPTMARNQELIFALGSPEPAACLILPIKVKNKIVGFLYGDRRDQPLGSIPMADLKRLMAKTDIAFQVYLLKGKLRVI